MDVSKTEEETDESYYSLMMNALSGLEDDLVANLAPQEARDYLRKTIEICWRDYEERFGR